MYSGQISERNLKNEGNAGSSWGSLGVAGFHHKKVSAFNAAVQHSETQWNIVQHSTTQCNTVQHSATQCNTGQHSATQGNTVQYSGTQCNAVRHSETPGTSNTAQNAQQNNTTQHSNGPNSKREHNTSYVTQWLGYVNQHPGKNSESGVLGIVLKILRPNSCSKDS